MEILIDQEEGGLLSGRGATNLAGIPERTFSAEVGELEGGSFNPWRGQ